MDEDEDIEKPTYSVLFGMTVADTTVRMSGSSESHEVVVVRDDDETRGKGTGQNDLVRLPPSPSPTTVSTSM